MSAFCLPESLKVVSGLQPTVGAAAALTGDYISVREAKMIWCVLHYHQADATQITFKVEKATAVANTGHTALTANVPIWANEDSATSDTLVRKTDAVTFQTSAAQADKIIIFQIDPSTLGSTYDVICASSTTAIAATSWLEIMYYIQPRYESDDASRSSAIVD